MTVGAGSAALRPKSTPLKRSAKPEDQSLFFIDSTGTLLVRALVHFYSAIDILTRTSPQRHYCEPMRRDAGGPGNLRTACLITFPFFPTDKIDNDELAKFPTYMILPSAENPTPSGNASTSTFSEASTPIVPICSKVRRPRGFRHHAPFGASS